MEVSQPLSKEAREMRSISDLMASLSQLSDGAMRGCRKTSEDPPRVSVLDVISAVTGLDSSNASNVVTSHARSRNASAHVRSIPHQSTAPAD